jgi:hypothetical protein
VCARPDRGCRLPWPRPAGGPAPADPRQRPRARQSDRPGGRRRHAGRC